MWVFTVSILILSRKSSLACFILIKKKGQLTLLLQKVGFSASCCPGYFNYCFRVLQQRKNNRRKEVSGNWKHVLKNLELEICQFDSDLTKLLTFSRSHFTFSVI